MAANFDPKDMRVRVNQLLTGGARPEPTTVGKKDTGKPGTEYIDGSTLPSRAPVTKFGQLARSIVARSREKIPSDPKEAGEYFCREFGDCPNSPKAGAAMAELALMVPDLTKLGDA